MFWVAFKGYNNGKAISLDTESQLEAEAYGMHGYPTAAEAQAKPNSVNVLEKTQVNAWVIAANDITGSPAKDATHAASAAGKAVANATGASSAITSVEDFLQGLTSKNLWIRAAKISIGGIIILIAVAKMTGTGSAISKIPLPVKAAP